MSRVVRLDDRREASLPTIEIRPGRVIVNEPIDLDPEALSRFVRDLDDAGDLARRARPETEGEVVPLPRRR
jgi:hypothetical protein